MWPGSCDSGLLTCTGVHSVLCVIPTPNMLTGRGAGWGSTTISLCGQAVIISSQGAWCSLPRPPFNPTISTCLTARRLPSGYLLPSVWNVACFSSTLSQLHPSSLCGSARCQHTVTCILRCHECRPAQAQPHVDCIETYRVEHKPAGGGVVGGN